MANFPTGTVTFLFSDIEGSTKLALSHPDIWETLRHRHHSILQSAMDALHGYVFQIIGDAFCVAFNTAGEALLAARYAQENLFIQDWGDNPVKVRMGIHTGRAEVQNSGQYIGYLTMSRVQRLMSAGHGGQILLSQVTKELVCDELPKGTTLVDLGERRFKDLIRPEHVYQVNIESLPSEFPPIKTLEIFKHNLPIQLTSFVGREKEIGEIKQAILHHKLVTLTGPAGAGKTRLSLQVAADLIDELPDGVWFVDLALLSDPKLVPQALASVLNVREEGATPLMDLLNNYVKRRELLIVIDNCEHLVEASASAVNSLLHAAPQLKIISTSREGLGVTGEKIFLVPSLSLPSSHSHSILELAQYEGTRLFIDRALLVQPNFTVTNENAPAIAQICNRLDGIPLAIELAAARIKVMSPKQIASRLDDSFRLLTGGSRTALPRQQTLRATIDWSWELLTEKERTLLQRLSIFSGGWTLEAAEEICAGDGIESFEILDLLTQLVSKSLVVCNDQLEESRYHLLETIRQYARMKLKDEGQPGEETLIRQNHAEFYAQFVEKIASQIYSPDRAACNRQLDIEHDNLRSAKDWSVESRSEIALRIVKASGDNFYWKDKFEEGIQWCNQALTAVPDPQPLLRAYSLIWSSIYSNQIGRKDQANINGKEGLKLARQIQNKELLALALLVYGSVSLESGEPLIAKECMEEALHLATEIRSPFVLPGVLGYIGLIHILASEYEKAELFFQKSKDMAQALYSTPWLPIILFNSGTLAFLRSDIEKARAELELGLQLANELYQNPSNAHIEEMLGRIQILDADLISARKTLTRTITQLQEKNLTPCLAHGLESWARLALAQGDPKHAASILGAINSYLRALGLNMIPVEQALFDQTLAAVQKELDPATFQEQWSAGEKLNIRQAIEYAMS